MSEQKIYDDFINWLGQSWWELTESEHLEPMIRAYLTAEEAAFLTNIPHSPKSLEEIAAIKEMDASAVSEKLKKLANKGMIFETERDGSFRYRLSDSFFTFLRAAFWPDQASPEAKAAAPHVNAYFLDGWFAQYMDIHHKGLRSIPIGRSIKDSRGIMPFEDIVQVIEDRDYYTVSICPCRHRHNLDDDTLTCTHEMEVCLHFDDLGRYAVANGQGREITKEETYAILKKAADNGLVHGISNWKEKPDTICNCCNDACMWFESFHKLKDEKSLDVSNYSVASTPEKCRACGLCIKRCPMDALQLKYFPEATNKFYKAVEVAEELCIGCGVCVHKCPTKAITLVRNQELTEPPEDQRAYGMAMFKDKMAAKARREQEADQS